MEEKKPIINYETSDDTTEEKKPTKKEPGNKDEKKKEKKSFNIKKMIIILISMTLLGLIVCFFGYALLSEEGNGFFIGSGNFISETNKGSNGGKFAINYKFEKKFFNERAYSAPK